MTAETAKLAINIAKAHVEKASMRSSADMCLGEAAEAMTRKDYLTAFKWAQRSLGYSVGILHNAYQRVALLGKEVVS